MTNATLSPVAMTANTVEIQDADGRPLVSYDPSTGQATVHLAGADLAVRAKDGRIELTSDQDIVLRSARTVEIDGRRGVRIQGDRTTFKLGRRSVLEAPSLEARIENVQFSGERVEATAKDAVFSWGRLRQVADRWFQFARDMYQRIEAALDTQAGRMRTSVDRTYHVRSDQMRFLAREEVRIDGKTINMG